MHYHDPFSDTSTAQTTVYFHKSYIKQQPMGQGVQLNSTVCTDVQPFQSLASIFNPFRGVVWKTGEPSLPGIHRNKLPFSSSPHISEPIHRGSATKSFIVEYA